MSEEIIAERKSLLAKYMNILSREINIFADEDIVKFLKLDFNSQKVKTLREALDQNLELYELMSSSKTAGGSKTHNISPTPAIYGLGADL